MMIVFKVNRVRAIHHEDQEGHKGRLGGVWTILPD